MNKLINQESNFSTIEKTILYPNKIQLKLETLKYNFDKNLPVTVRTRKLEYEDEIKAKM